MKKQTTASPVPHDSPATRKPARSTAQPKAAPAPVAGNSDDRYEMIRQTAYGFYVARGCVSGHELQDWLQAEADVDAAIARADQGSGSPTPATAAA